MFQIPVQIQIAQHYYPLRDPAKVGQIEMLIASNWALGTWFKCSQMATRNVSASLLPLQLQSLPPPHLSTTPFGCLHLRLSSPAKRDLVAPHSLCVYIPLPPIIPSHFVLIRGGRGRWRTGCIFCFWTNAITNIYTFCDKCLRWLIKRFVISVSCS